MAASEATSSCIGRPMRHATSETILLNDPEATMCRPRLTLAILLLALVGRQNSACAQSLPHLIDIEWSLAPNMPQGLQDSDGGIIDNYLVTSGGFARGETIPGKVYPRGFVHETWGLDLGNQAAGWQSLPDFPGSNNPANVDGAGRQELASVVVNNEIYSWGGFNYTAPFAYADGYRLSRNGGTWTWDALPPLPHAVSSPGVTAVGDVIYTLGGADYDAAKFYTNTDRNGGTPNLGAKFYQLDTNNLAAGWTALPDLPGTPRWVHSTTSIGDQIYVFGGATGDEADAAFPYRSIVDNWRFDTANGTWHQLADLPVSSGNFSNGQVVVDDRYILLIGGFQYEEVRNPDGSVRPKYGQATKTIPGNVYFSDVFVYDTMTDVFGRATDLPNNNNLPMAVVEGSQLYLLGGEAGGFTFDGELFGHHPESVFVGDMTIVFDAAVSLFVNQQTGAVRMQNVSSTDVSMDGYEIASLAGSLDPSAGAWHSLESTGVHPGWMEIGSPSNSLLAELNPHGTTTLAPGQSMALGTPFTALTTELGQTPATGDLTFGFSTDGGDVLAGVVAFEAPVTLVLLVDPNTGQTVLSNPTAIEASIDGYEVRSDGGSLEPTSWLSLEGNPNFDGWQEIATPTDELLAELNPSGALILDAAAAVHLGPLFGVGQLEDLEFQFSLASGQIIDGIVEYIELDADFNDNGVVDGSDLIEWQRGAGTMFDAAPADGDANLDGVVNNIDRVIWETQLGQVSTESTAAAVPEPSGMLLTAWALAFAVLGSPSRTAMQCRARTGKRRAWN